MDPQLPELKDIHLPATPDMWPLALGWWLLLALLVILFIYIVMRTKKYLRIKKYKRMLLNEFSQLEKKLKGPPNKIHITETNVLLRRLALAQYPNARVASLTGSDWLKFLDESGKTQNFSNGAGRILIEAPYRIGELENFNQNEFIALIRSWVIKATNAKITKHDQKVGVCH